MANETKAQRDAREQAEKLRALPGLGGGRGAAVRGADNAIPINYWEWLAQSPETREQLRASDQKIVITDAPEGFDPSKET